MTTTYTPHELGIQVQQGDPDYRVKWNTTQGRVDTLLGTGKLNLIGFWDGSTFQSATGDDSADDTAVVTALAGMSGSSYQAIIPAGKTIRLVIGAGNTITLPVGINLVFGHGASFHIETGELIVEGPVNCHGDGPFFNTESGAILVINNTIDCHAHAKLYTGDGELLFYRGPELVTNGLFATADGWTFTGACSWDEASTSAKFLTGAGTVSQAITTTAGKVYVVRFKLINYAAYYVQANIGSGYSELFWGDCSEWYEVILSSGATVGFTSTGNLFQGSITNISVREFKGSRFDVESVYHLDITPGVLTDQAPKINKAINHVASMQGGTVKAPPGRYALDTPVRLRAKAPLRGCGNNTQFYGLATFTGLGMFNLAGGEDLQSAADLLTDARINQSACPTTTAGIWINKTSNHVAFRRLYFNGSTNHTAIKVPRYIYSEAEIASGMPAAHHFMLWEDLLFHYYNSPSGVVVFDNSSDTQANILRGLRFKDITGVQMVLGCLNSTVEYLYSEWSATNKLMADGTGGLYPRIILTNTTQGPILFRDCYFDSATDVCIWSKCSTKSAVAAAAQESNFVLSGRTYTATYMLTLSDGQTKTGVKYDATHVDLDAPSVYADDYWYTLGQKNYIYMSNGTTMTRALVTGTAPDTPSAGKTRLTLSGTAPPTGALTCWYGIENPDSRLVRFTGPTYNQSCKNLYTDTLYIGKGGSSTGCRTGTALTQIVKGTVTLSSTSLADGTATSFTITLPQSVSTAATVYVTGPYNVSMANVVVTWALTAATTVTVYLKNNTGGAFVYDGIWKAVAIVGT